MRACVFLGPSLPLDAARALLPDAVYLPPARRGDVLDAVRAHDPEAVALIDGYFEQVPSVWHKELLWALDRGVALYGAASMGALRAAELAQFGMVGVGRIARAYAVGRFEPFDDPFDGDDEVAVVHGPAEIGYAASDALVDIRAMLARAAGEGVIDAGAMRVLAGAAKAVFYKHRTWTDVIGRAGLPAGDAAALHAWIAKNKFSQKRLDAEALLRHLASAEAGPRIPAFRFERTVLWEDALRRRERGGTV